MTQKHIKPNNNMYNNNYLLKNISNMLENDLIFHMLETNTSFTHIKKLLHPWGEMGLAHDEDLDE